MRKFWTSFNIAIMLFSSTLNAGELQLQIYIVQAGDSLSTIADRVRGGHTYGANENLEKILKLNPALKISQHIDIGQKIIVPNFVDDNPKTMARKTAAETAPAPMIVAPAPTPTPIPVATPAPAPVAAAPQVEPSKSVAPEEDISHSGSITGGYQFTTLHAEDLNAATSADLFTSRDLYIRALWKQGWSDVFNSFVSFTVRNLDFMDSTNASKHLTNTSQTMIALAAGGNSKISEHTKLTYSLAYGHELFIHGLTSTTIVIDSVAVPKATIGAEYEVLKKGLTSLGVAADGGFVGGASTDSFTVSSGYTYRTLAYLRREKQGHLLGLEIGFSERAQDTSVMSISEQSIFGNLQYSFDLFEGGR